MSYQQSYFIDIEINNKKEKIFARLLKQISR